MPAPRKRAGDVTGRQAEVLAEQNKEELQLRAAELSMMQAQAAEEKHDVVEVGPLQTKHHGAVEVEVPTKTFRVNTTLEGMTFGAGNNYDFEEGRIYKAPKPLYDHLESKGYIWH